MKKRIALIISVMLLFGVTGCMRSNNPASVEDLPDNYSQEYPTPLEELPDDYSLEQAKEDGCVTHEDGNVTQGKEIFEAFFRRTASGKAAQVRLADYYTLGDPSGYDPEYYESVKDDYPCLYIQDLSFDGEKYTIRWYEDGEEIIRNYSCLMKYEGPAESRDAIYQSYIRYVLTNDDSVTWQELIYGLTSSQLGDYMDHKSVCTEYIYE